MYHSKRKMTLIPLMTVSLRTLEDDLSFSPSCLVPYPEGLVRLDKTVWHEQYQCPVYTWFSKALVKSTVSNQQERFILYIEYRDHTRDSRYTQLSFRSLSEGTDFRDDKVSTMTLHRISPLMTMRFPIKPYAAMDE